MPIAEDTVVVQFKADAKALEDTLGAIALAAKRTGQAVRKGSAGGGAGGAAAEEKRKSTAAEHHMRLIDKELRKGGESIKLLEAQRNSYKELGRAGRSASEHHLRAMDQELRRRGSSLQQLDAERAAHRKIEQQKDRETRAYVSQEMRKIRLVEKRGREEKQVAATTTRLVHGSARAGFMAANAATKKVLIEKSHTQALRRNNQLIRRQARSARTLAQTLRRGMGGLNRMYRGVGRVAFGVTAWVRLFRTWGLALGNLFRTASRLVMGFLNLWKRVIVTALKFGAAIGVTLVGALALATKASVDFESAMLRVGGVLGRNMEQMQGLERSIRDVAKATTVSAQDIAGGAFQLASFGYGQRATAQMLPGVTALAMAASGERGGGGFEKSAEIIARMLLVWQKPATDAVRVANLLAAANATSAATFERLGQSMPKAAQAASLINMPMNELVATLSQLMNAGIEGTGAGAALLQMIVRLMNPTKRMTDAWTDNLARIGLTMRDVNPAVVGFRKALQNLVAAGLRPEELALIRSKTALIALNVLVKQGTREHDRMTSAITGTNQAQKQAAIIVSGVKGRWAFFTASLKELYLTLTEKLRPALAWMFDRIGKWINWFSQTPQVKSLAAAIGKLAEKIALLVDKLLLVSAEKIINKWAEIVAALASYMRRAAKIIVTVLALIESLFVQLTDKNSPLRKLWSSFWDFVQTSVVWATQGVVGLVAGMMTTLQLMFDQSETLAAQWGTTFAAMIITTVQMIAVEVAEMASELVSEFAPLAKLIGGFGAEFVVKQVAGTIADYAQELKARSPEDMVEDVRERMSEIARMATRREGYRAGYAGIPYQEALARVRAQRPNLSEAETRRNALKLSGRTPIGAGADVGVAQGKAWGVQVRSLMGGVGGGGGGVATPISAGIGGVVFNAINAFEKVALKPIEAMVGAIVGDEQGRLGALKQSQDDNTEATEGLTSVTEKLADRMDGILGKIIGAPQELVNRYMSPAGMYGGGPGGNLGYLQGRQGTHITIHQTNDFGEGIKQRLKWEMEQGEVPRLVERKTSGAARQMMDIFSGTR